MSYLRGWAVFLLRRLGYLIVSLLVVSAVTFGATRLLGNPAYLLVGTTFTKEQLAKVEQQLGLDKPIYVQYAQYMINLLHGDLGTSRNTFNPVTEDIQRRLPATLELATYSLLLGALWSIPAGYFAGRNGRGWFSRIADVIAQAGVSVPNFWLGLILIFLLYAVLHVLPPPLGRLGPGVSAPPTVTGWYTIDSLIAGKFQTFWEALKQLIMPALTLAFTTSPSLFQITRNATENVYKTDYMRTAKAFGLSARTIARYALKNILVPVLTMLAMTYGYLIGGTVLVEVVFAWPGLGLYAVNAMNHSDFEPIVGVVLLSALAYILIYLVADVVNSFIDPRIRMEGL